MIVPTRTPLSALPEKTDQLPVTTSHQPGNRPLIQRHFDTTCRINQPTRRPSPDYDQTLTNVSSLPDYSTSTSYGLAGNGRRGIKQLSMDAGRNRASRAMWHLLNALQIQGHSRIDRALMQHLQEVAPPVSNNTRILQILAATKQTLATIPGVRDRLRNWAIREGGEVSTDISSPSLNHPQLHHWNEPELWSYITWTTAVAVITRFLNCCCPKMMTIHPGISGFRDIL